jgi:uncharacterized membrane protein YagU involved in acid resistance
MNWASWIVWGFAATIVLTILLAGSQGLKLTRMNVPLLLGTMFSPDRDKAKWIGIFMHIVNGFIFSFIYVAAFNVWGGPNVWKGAIIGFVHATFVLTVGLPNLPGIHPRMAGEHFGPTVVKQLEPPGFFSLNYGAQTPISVILAHMVFGMILGHFYQPY